MRSIKRGRGPSMMGGITSICMAVFGLIWTIMAGSMAGPLFGMFGVVFIVIAISQAVYNFKNATGENRYSEYDITEGYEEVDPLNERFGRQSNGMEYDSQSGNWQYREADSFGGNASEGSAFCPYCGTRVENSFEFCHKCGKKLP